MKRSEVFKRIDEVCDQSKTSLMSRGEYEFSQKLLGKIGPLREASRDSDGSLEFNDIERVLKQFVKKYKLQIGCILVITDIKGEMLYNAGASSGIVNGRSQWLFTVHSPSLYELYMKLVMVLFKMFKEGKLDER